MSNERNLFSVTRPDGSFKVEMPGTSPMSEEELDLERCACLFSVEVSDLEHKDDMYEPDDVARFPKYWYDGPPEWAEGDFSRDERNSPSGRYRTLIVACMDGKPRIPTGWRFVQLYRSAPERDCAWCGAGTGNEATRSTCQLCEGDGHLYWGEEWCEVVIEQPLLEAPGNDDRDGSVFLGSTTWGVTFRDDVIELWVSEIDGDTVYSGVWSDDWPGEMDVTERMLRHNPKLLEACPWIAVAQERAKSSE